ncbi:MAG: hypothetical protein HQ472_00735 [Ignavibacteria bacterium]|nr:hypothetical protein [Ignavibacteria bacterium]
MSTTEIIARLEHALRPTLATLPPKVAVKIMSAGRRAFMRRFVAETPKPLTIPTNLTVKIWDISFRLPILNAAGMFKNGEGYAVVAAQGAGGYVAGTTTFTAREGNVRDGVKWPVAMYPLSGVASNWLGLPNPGHAEVAKRLSTISRVAGCPIGASMSADSGVEETISLDGLAQGFAMYDKAGVDFIEINESCPNVTDAHHGLQVDAGLIRRLEFIAQHLLHKRTRNLPVVVKLSTDVAADQILDLIPMLETMGFDGMILGNTSTNYGVHRADIQPAEEGLYEYFTQTFGGGLSGSVLRGQSAELVGAARRCVAELSLRKEFRIIQCGGICGAEDVVGQADELHQWYSGYFDQFARYGHRVYQEFARGMA